MKKLIILVLLLAVPSIAADKVIMATTDDGRRVALMPDGKWVFVEGESKNRNMPPDEDWQKVVKYFQENGYVLKAIDSPSKTLQTDWHDVVAIGVETRSIQKKVNLGMQVFAEWCISCSLSGPEATVSFKYRMPSEGESYDNITLDEICANPFKSFKKSCSELKANENVIREDIRGLLKNN